MPKPEELEQIECKPARALHVIDRRDYLRDGQNNYVLVNGQRQLNFKCTCGQLSAHAAEYRGGEYEFAYLDAEEVLAKFRPESKPAY